MVRLLGAAFCLAMGSVLLYWAFCSSRLAVRDVDFVLESPLMDPWAQTWLMRADDARFRHLDSVRAVDAYWQAVGRNPLLFGGWFALARLERQLGDVQRADALHDFLLASVPPSRSWGWQHLLLASDRRDDARFEQSFNFVLANLPKHRQEAVELALGFWGGWPAVLSRAEAANKWTVLMECMARKAVDESIGLYAALEADPQARPDASAQARFIDFLLGSKRWHEAAETWRRSELFQGSLVDNGGFEMPFSGTAFGWRQARLSGVEVRRDSRRDTEGHAMRFHFLGTTNLRYDHFFQYVSVDPGRAYELRFAAKSERLSSDRGPYLEVRGMECPGLRAKSPEITGSRAWSGEVVAFEVPEGCRVVRVGVRRDESLKFDNKIAGDFWIDDLEIVQQRKQP
jgi:hypothetical protein